MRPGGWRTAALLLAGLLLALPLQAQVHASLAQAWNGAGPGSETQATLLWAPYGGLRLSQLAGVELEPTLERNDQSLTLTRPQANLLLPQVLWLWDYLSYGAGRPMPFDFLTAYLALGQAQGELDLAGKSYQVQGRHWATQPLPQETAPGRLNAVSLGFYGGESFVSLDIGLRRLWGSYGATGEQEFRQLQLLLALGVGF